MSCLLKKRFDFSSEPITSNLNTKFIQHMSTNTFLNWCLFYPAQIQCLSTSKETVILNTRYIIYSQGFRQCKILLLQTFQACFLVEQYVHKQYKYKVGTYAYIAQCYVVDFFPRKLKYQKFSQRDIPGGTAHQQRDIFRRIMRFLACTENRLLRIIQSFMDDLLLIS